MPQVNNASSPRPLRRDPSSPSGFRHYRVTRRVHEKAQSTSHATQQQYARFTVLALFQKQTGEHESVTLELVRDFKDGAERFIILDWPSFTRSDESKAVEAEIRAQLAARQASNQAMQRTANRPYT